VERSSNIYGVTTRLIGVGWCSSTELYKGFDLKIGLGGEGEDSGKTVKLSSEWVGPFSTVASAGFESVWFMDRDLELLSLCRGSCGGIALIVSMSHSGSTLWVAVGVDLIYKNEAGVGRESFICFTTRTRDAENRPMLRSESL